MPNKNLHCSNLKKKNNKNNMQANQLKRRQNNMKTMKKSKEDRKRAKSEFQPKKRIRGFLWRSSSEGSKRSIQNRASISTTAQLAPSVTSFIKTNAPDANQRMTISISICNMLTMKTLVTN